MRRMTSNLAFAALAGQVVGQLGWIDPLFVALVLLGPSISGAIAAAKQVSYAWIAVLWFSAGIAMAWSDWVVNHEDVAFHLALSVVMPVLAGIGYGAVRLANRPRRTAAR